MLLSYLAQWSTFVPHTRGRHQRSTTGVYFCPPSVATTPPTRSPVRRVSGPVLSAPDRSDLNIAVKDLFRPRSSHLGYMESNKHSLMMIIF